LFKSIADILPIKLYIILQYYSQAYNKYVDIYTRIYIEQMLISTKRFFSF